MQRFLRIYPWLLIAALVSASCGVKGPPLPPEEHPQATDVSTAPSGMATKK